MAIIIQIASVRIYENTFLSAGWQISLFMNHHDAPQHAIKLQLIYLMPRDGQQGQGVLRWSPPPFQLCSALFVWALYRLSICS